MKIILVALVLTIGINIIAQKYGRLIRENSIDLSTDFIIVKKPNRFLYIISVIILIIISGMRSSIGDTGYYLYSFKYLPDSLDEIIRMRDFGFGVFSFLVKVVYDHPQFLLIVTSILILTLIMSTIYKYSPFLLLSLFVFLTSGSYVSTMNGIRQFIVASILFASLHLLINGRYLKYIIIVLILSTIHQSVLIMIPVYFIVREKAWSKKILTILIVSSLFIFGFEYFFNVFSFLLKDTQYGHYIYSIETGIDQGANVLRIGVAAVPVLLGYYHRGILNDKLVNYNVYMNFSILNLVFMMLASYNWIFARFSMYFGLYNLILLPAIIYYCYRGWSKVLIVYLMVVLYLIYFYFNTKDLIYASYYLNINRELIGPLTRSIYN